VRIKKQNIGKHYAPSAVDWATAEELEDGGTSAKEEVSKRSNMKREK
jgi:hypothetical protein